MIKDLEMIVSAYASLQEKVEEARKVFGKPLMLTEKILISHLAEPLQKTPERLKSYVNFNPDRVAMQDATAQMAMLQFMMSGRSKTSVPSTVHCDHLIRAVVGAEKDLASANSEKAKLMTQQDYRKLSLLLQVCKGNWDALPELVNSTGITIPEAKLAQLLSVLKLMQSLRKIAKSKDLSNITVTDTIDI
ncbi:MAG: hypothetical protein COA98_05575, partial [Candidatus Neomarinimicrobiota bacterium]